MFVAKVDPKWGPHEVRWLMLFHATCKTHVGIKAGVALTGEDSFLGLIHGWSNLAEARSRGPLLLLSVRRLATTNHTFAPSSIWGRVVSYP